MTMVKIAKHFFVFTLRQTDNAKVSMVRRKCKDNFSRLSEPIDIQTRSFCRGTDAVGLWRYCESLSAR